MDPFEDSTVVPGPEYASAREIRQIDFAHRPVRVFEPDPSPFACLYLERSNHAFRPLQHHF